MTSRTRTTKAQIVQVPEFGEVVTPDQALENPGKTNAEIKAILSDTHVNEIPTITLPADDLVTLPGGLIKDDQLIRTAVVKELTGQDEEALAKASQSMSVFHFIDRLLRCGVVQIGDFPPSKTESLLKELLVGDREALILGIRRATYGEELDIEKWKCLNCGTDTDLSMELSDIPSVSLDNPEEEIVFEVPLRKGRSATVRLANGADQTALYENKELTTAERQSILLSRCVIEIEEANGRRQSMAAFPSLALGMSIPDRHKILDELDKRQPGPKYDQVSYTCDACGEEVKVAVGLAHLFLDFGWI